MKILQKAYKILKIFLIISTLLVVLGIIVIALINVGINAFGALTNLKNGQLLESEGLKHLMSEAVKEAVQVAKQKKIQLSDKDFTVETYNVARRTSNNKNSMLQDILNGMATEIDFINGRVLKYAKDLGVNVPINELLTHLIKGLESSSI